MPDTKWTPGPWEAKRGNAGAQHPLFVWSDDRDGFRPWTDPDAHLIAAAPDLYAALELLLSVSTDHNHIDQARAALAKARGENTKNELA
jgi:hypothetical protein